MLKIIGVVAIIIVVAILALLAVAATKPDSFRIQRSTRIQAAPEKIAALVNDFHQWGRWSPFEHIDPTMKRTYGGAPSGVGAEYGWTGQGKAGAGHMRITQATPALTAIDLDFTKPMKASNVAEFTYEPDGDATRVTWAMHGPQPFVSKVMGTVFNMDKMVGAEFEKGLADLKRAAES